jgi:hypothetical protein
VALKLLVDQQAITALLALVDLVAKELFLELQEL